MAKSSFEFTDETRWIHGVLTRRIRAVRDIPVQGVKKGDLGGFVQYHRNVQGDGWVFDNAAVTEGALVADRGAVRDTARVFDRATVLDNGSVRDIAVLQDDSRVIDDAIVSGEVILSGRAAVCDNAVVSGGRFSALALIGGDAWVGKKSHFVFVSPVGSEGVKVTLWRTEEGHSLNVGCWTDGTLDELAAEVERRSGGWSPSVDADAVRAQYRGLEVFLRASMSGWHD